jgi:NAD(P)-dependent dehydrogenase (short-subunit alcohol dehydrogenase family)
MSAIIIVGGSKGIGASIVETLSISQQIHNLSRTTLDPKPVNVTHHNFDVLTDDFPELEDVSTLIYCPGSINWFSEGRRF